MNQSKWAYKVVKLVSRYTVISLGVEPKHSFTTMYVLLVNVRVVTKGSIGSPLILTSILMMYYSVLSY